MSVSDKEKEAGEALEDMGTWQGFLPPLGMLVPHCHLDNGDPGDLSRMLTHDGINQKYNPALIGNLHLKSS